VASFRPLWFVTLFEKIQLAVAEMVLLYHIRDCCYSASATLFNPIFSNLKKSFLISELSKALLTHTVILGFFATVED